MINLYKIHDHRGRAYIGVTNNPQRRWQQHRWALRRGKHYNPKLQRAWTKYGEKCFTFTPVADDNAYASEKRLIEQGHGHYNLKPGGIGGGPISAAACRKISEAHKGKHHSTATRCKMSEAHEGKHHSAATRRKISEANAGKPSVWKGKHLSADYRRKISEALRGKPLSAETRRKISESSKGKHLSAETRRKMSEARKRFNQRMRGPQ